MSNELTGIGSTTANWVDVPIALNNCPAFFGAFRGATTNDSGVTQRSTANQIAYRVDPVTSVVNPAQGVMALQPDGMNPTAQGIGIQLADAGNNPVSYGTARASGLALNQVDGASYTIPLKARYYQTEAYDRGRAGQWRGDRHPDLQLMEATMHIRRSALIPWLALAVLLPVQATAQDLTIRFQGRFLESTCSLAVGDDSRTINLDTVYSGDLPANGAYGFKDFALTVENCTPDLSQATFTFAGQPDVDDPLRYRSTGTAGGMAIELQSAADGRTIGANGTDAARTSGIVGARASLDLRAAYWRVGTRPLSTGTVSAIATVVVTYN